MLPETAPRAPGPGRQVQASFGIGAAEGRREDLTPTPNGKARCVLSALVSTVPATRVAMKCPGS